MRKEGGYGSGSGSGLNEYLRTCKRDDSCSRSLSMNTSNEQKTKNEIMEDH